MTYGTERRPGAFYARCNLARTVMEHLAKPADKDEATRLGLRRRQVGTTHKGKPIWAWDFPHEEGPYEFTDAASYTAHMDEHHRGGNKLSGPWLKIPAKLWTGPRLSAQGKPFDDKGAMRTCPHGCGLIAEVNDTHEAALWWDEHLRGCLLARAGAAS